MQKSTIFKQQNYAKTPLLLNSMTIPSPYFTIGKIIKNEALLVSMFRNFSMIFTIFLMQCEDI